VFDDTTRRQRAVSDLVAFTLTFAIIVSGIGFVYVSGFDALGDLRDGEKANSADRTMQGIAETYEEIHEEDIPGRSLEIELGGSSIRTVESRLVVRVNDSAPTESTMYERTLGPRALVLDSQGVPTTFVYEIGGLFRLGREGQLLRHRPTFECTDDRATLSLISLRGNISLGGQTSVVLVGQHVDEGSEKLFPGPDPSSNQYFQPTEAGNVTIDVSQMAASDAWKQYFSRSGWEESGRDGEFYCKVDKPGDDGGTVFLRRTVIELSTIY
jgi:hypothetical protein